MIKRHTNLRILYFGYYGGYVLKSCAACSAGAIWRLTKLPRLSRRCFSSPTASSSRAWTVVCIQHHSKPLCHTKNTEHQLPQRDRATHHVTWRFRLVI